MHTTSSEKSYFLNLRFLLITLVVVVNMIEPLAKEAVWLYAVYRTIYLFHIPLFAFAFGYFSRGKLGKEELLRSLPTILYQYTLFQSLYSLMDILLFKQAAQHSFFLPYSLLWFVISLYGWKMMTALLSHFKHPILISFLLGCLVGFLPFDGAVWSVSRTLVFLPFFILGYDFNQRWLFLSPSFGKRSWIGCLGLLVCASAIFLGMPFPGQSWFVGNVTFAQMDVFPLTAVMFRLWTYVLQLTAGYCVLMLVTAKTYWLTDSGSRTLYVFLYHALIVKTLHAIGIGLQLPILPATLLYVTAALVLTYLLSRPAVERRLFPFTEPEIRLPLARLRS